MGYPELTQVNGWLQEAGFRVFRGFPGKCMPRIEWPVVAISLHSIDTAEKTRTICASVCTPTGSDGGSCEDTAAGVTQVLADHGAICTQSACRYDNWGNFFWVQVLAQWREPEPEAFSASIWANPLPFAVEVSAARAFRREGIGAMGESTPVAELLIGEPWQVTLVEEFPLGEPGNADVQEPFTLTVVRNRATEVYAGCRWTEICRIDTKTGLRQTRKAEAAERRLTIRGENAV